MSDNGTKDGHRLVGGVEGFDLGFNVINAAGVAGVQPVFSRLAESVLDGNSCKINAIAQG